MTDDTRGPRPLSALSDDQVRAFAERGRLAQLAADAALAAAAADPAQLPLFGDDAGRRPRRRLDALRDS